MRVGVFTPLLSQFPLEKVLEKLKTLDIGTVELGHRQLSRRSALQAVDAGERERAERVEEEARRQRFFHQRAELPRQPAPSRSRPSGRAIRTRAKKTVLLAAEARRAGGDRLLRLSRRQRNREVSELGHVPVAAGVSGRARMAVGQSGDSVLEGTRQVRRRSRREDRHRDASRASSSTARRRCSVCAPSAGPSVGCNYDPSHMFWQGIDPIAAIRVLGDCIFHVHAKDTQIYERNLPLTGVLDTKKYTDERNRAWIFRTCRLRPRVSVVEGVHLHAADVRL